MKFYRVYLKNDGQITRGATANLEPRDNEHVWFCPETGLIVQETIQGENAEKSVRVCFHISKIPGDGTFITYFFNDRGIETATDKDLFGKHIDTVKEAVKIEKSKKATKKCKKR